MLTAVLIGAMALAAQGGPPGRLLESPTPELTPVVQEADSLVWELAWTPGVIRGSSPTGYEWEADWSLTDEEGFADGATGSGIVAPDVRTARFRSPRVCGDTLWIHGRVRAVGEWVVQGERVTSTPWGRTRIAWAPLCEDPPPDAPEPGLDTVPPDTLDFDELLDRDTGVDPDSLRAVPIAWSETMSAEDVGVGEIHYTALGQTVWLCTYTWRNGVQYRARRLDIEPLRVMQDGQEASLETRIVQPELLDLPQHCFRLRSIRADS